LFQAASGPLAGNQVARFHGQALPWLTLHETAQPNRHTRYDGFEPRLLDRNLHGNITGCTKAQVIDGRFFQYGKDFTVP
jgi:hypothetical protein